MSQSTNREELQSLVLNQVPGIAHGFGGRGAPVPARLVSLWDSQKPQWKQNHGTSLARVLSPGQACGEVDALWTDQKQGWVGVVTADCLPILMAARDGSAVAAIHSGWRGTLSRIVEKTWQSLREAGHDPKNWVAAIGPCIQACCFEVGEDLQEKFICEFSQKFSEDLSGSSKSLLNPRFRYLNLSGLTRVLLENLGMHSVEVLPQCTRCSTDTTGQPLFHSYRREGGGTRQLSVIGRIN